MVAHWMPHFIKRFNKRQYIKICGTHSKGVAASPAFSDFIKSQMIMLSASTNVLALLWSMLCSQPVLYLHHLRLNELWICCTKNSEKLCNRTHSAGLTHTVHTCYLFGLVYTHTHLQDVCSVIADLHRLGQSLPGQIWLSAPHQGPEPGCHWWSPAGTDHPDHR